VSGVQPYLPGGDRRIGGVVGYPLDDLYEEVAFVAYHFHWPLKDILDLEHGDRQRFIEEISAINKEMSQQAAPAAPSRGIPLQFWDPNA
jgi:uncharacterized protein DUF6760